MIGWCARQTLRLLGWRWQGEFPSCSKLVMIVAPHTSNWDLPMAMLFKWALGVKVSYLAKHTLFWWPLGWFLRSTGAIPVRRDRHHDVVNQVAQQFEQSSRLWLAIAPAGTRPRTDHWRSGFYHIVQAAGVPLVPVRLDFGPKELVFGVPHHVTGHVASDMDHLRAFFRGVRGLKHQHTSPVRLSSEAEQARPPGSADEPESS